MSTVSDKVFAISVHTYNQLPASERKTNAETRQRYVKVNGEWRPVVFKKDKPVK